MTRYLGTHPDVYVGPGKELHFWDSHYDRGFEWYESLFAGHSSASVICDATPFITHFDAVECMSKELPDVRLIVMLRNPVDRIYSHYWHNRRRGYESLGFWAALEQEPSRTGGDPSHVFAYRGKNDYVALLDHLVASFSREQVLVLDNENLRMRPETTVAQAWTHIGADPAACAGSDFAKDRRIGFARRVRRRLSGKSSRAARTYPALDVQSRTLLLAEFEPTTAAAEEWLGTTLPHWRI